MTAAEPGRHVSAAEIRKALDRVGDGILLINGEGVVQYCNAAVAELAETTPEQVIGKAMWELAPEEARADAELTSRALLESAQSVAFQEFSPEADKHFEIQVNSGAGGMTVIVRDVTESRRLENERLHALDELRRATTARERFQALVEASDSFIAFTDEDQQIAYVNPRGRDLIGVGPEVPASDLSWDLLMDLGAFAASVTPDMRERNRWEGQASLRHQATGEVIPVSGAVFGIADPEDGSRLAWASVQRDIRSLLAADKQLRELAAHRRVLLDRLVAAQEAERAQIAADVHDDSVQALLAVDRQLAGLAGEVAACAPQLDGQMRVLTETVGEATARLQHLLFDLEPPAPGEALVDSLKIAAAHATVGSHIAWSVAGDRDVQLSPQSHTQAVRIAKEAIGNAVQHADGTRVSIRVRQRDDGVEIEVADDGVGLDPADAASPRGHRGLTTMRDRAEIAGGWWRLERGEPRGTVVRFLLPGVRA